MHMHTGAVSRSARASSAVVISDAEIYFSYDHFQVALPKDQRGLALQECKKNKRGTYL